MTTVDRKEYQETKILRTVSPVRTLHRSNQNLAEFDHNLDYILEDLQNSVSRPGSSLGSHHEITKSNSLNRFTNVKAANPVTEYSSDDAYNFTSPDGTKRVTGFKKESYSYSSSGGPEKTRMQNNINQLDTLLDDLQQVKNGSFEENGSYNSSGVDPEFQKSKTTSSKRSVQRELHYGDTPRSSSTGRIEQKYSSEGTYGQLRDRSPSPSSRSSTLTRQTKVKNLHSYPLEVVETTTPDINPEILAHLDPNLHPPGNTKVTTTIKTYTYEIPGSGSYPTSLDSSVVDTEKFVYSPNDSKTTPSKSFVYKKTDNKINTVNYQTAPPEWQTNVKETITTRNYQPGYSPDSLNQNYVYNDTVLIRDVDENVPRARRPQETYIEDHHTVTKRNVDRSDAPRKESYLVQEYNNVNAREKLPPAQHYVKEVHNTNTTTNVHQPNGYPPHDNKVVTYRQETHTTKNYRPGDVDGFEPKQRPNEPVNIQYRYKSESTTTNNYKTGYPPEGQPLLPKPFPTDGQVDGPPKRLDELMATIGNEPPNSPYNAGFNAHEQELEQKKKIDTLKQQQAEIDDAQRKEPIHKSKNVSGPPVYYPPGHEMFAKKEESSAAWRAQGGYEKASGKYQYEADSKSKSKGASGAAIVPVCLPLCCGLPCTIL